MAFKDFVESVLLKAIEGELHRPAVQELVKTIVTNEVDVEEVVVEVLQDEANKLDLTELTEEAVDAAHPGLEDDVAELVHDKVSTYVDDLLAAIDLEQIVKDAVEGKLARALEAIRQDS